MNENVKMNMRGTIHRTCYLFFLLFVATLCVFTGQAKGQLSIVMSSRWFHEPSAKDSLSTLKAFEDFKATRIDWMYADNPKYLEQLKMKNIPFSLAINPQIPDSGAYTTVKTRMTNLYGVPYVAPWMKGTTQSNPYWGCVNNPVFKNLFNERGRKLIDLGAYGIMVDDARFNDQALDWVGEGCYCTYCMREFTKYLIAKGYSVSADFDYRSELLNANSIEVTYLRNKYRDIYREFETESVIKFLKDWIADIRSYAKKRIVFLTNNYLGKWTKIYSVFDEGLCEFHEKDIDYLTILDAINNAKKIEKKQIFSFETENENLLYGAIFYTYINGSEALVPWDMWIMGRSTGAKPYRFYGSREQFGDMIDIINNVILNKSFLKTNDVDVLKELSLDNRKYTCYKYSNGMDNYYFIFNLNFKNSSAVSLKSSEISLNTFNTLFAKHYNSRISKRGTDNISSAFILIKR